MKYRLRDSQFEVRYYGGDMGVIFETKEEIREELIKYHSCDCNEDSLKKMSLNELLEFGEWEIEELMVEV